MDGGAWVHGWVGGTVPKCRNDKLAQKHYTRQDRKEEKKLASELWFMAIRILLMSVLLPLSDAQMFRVCVRAHNNELQLRPHKKNFRFLHASFLSISHISGAKNLGGKNAEPAWLPESIDSRLLFFPLEKKFDCEFLFFSTWEKYWTLREMLTTS